MEKTTQKLLAFLTKKPNATKTDITVVIGLKGLQLFNLLKKLKNDGTIIENEEGPEKTYSAAPVVEKESTPLKTEPAETNSVGRDNSKFKFNDEFYGKGPLVRAVVAQYVADNPKVTYKQLKEVFPDELLKRFGIFQDEQTAKTIAPKGKRYFDKPEQMIKLKDRHVLVCNQFTLANIQPFLKVAKALGYKIK